MQWFGRCAIQPDHFKSHYGVATPLRRGIFAVRRSAFCSDHEQEHEHERE
jgi:hypothetical protein